MKREFYHQPVMADMVVEYLITNSQGVYVDCTVGGGGHSELILNRLEKTGKLLCFDADQEALKFAEKHLNQFSNKVLKQIFFDQLDVVLVEENTIPVDGFIFDLGLSSYQIDHKEKGFSFRLNGPLDMRFSTKQQRTAKDVVNTYSEERLQKILREYGEERYWRKIGKKIVEYRDREMISTTSQLANIISNVIGENYRIKSLARIFQAIRIEVNNELDRLKIALEKAFKYLSKNGRIVVISYHSLEDRIVKDFFRLKEKDCICPKDFSVCVCDKISEMRVLTKRAIRPSYDEINSNPRARSARLRVAEKIVSFKRDL